MGEATYVQSDFLGGEWSPFMQGRMDRKDYRSALNVCLNGYPIESGAWMRRQGTRHAGATRQGKYAKLLPFDFERNFPHTLEFTDTVMRAWVDQQRVLTNINMTVVSISAATPAVVTTSVPHGMVGTRAVVFDLHTSLWPLLYNRVFTATVLSATTFSIADELTGAAIDGSTLGTAPTGVLVFPVEEYDSPYTGQDQLSALRLVQAEKLAVILSSTASPKVIQIVTEPTAGNFAKFSIGSAPPDQNLQNPGAILVDGPYLDWNGSTLIDGPIVGNQREFTISGTFPDPRAPAGFVHSDLGRCFRLYRTPANWVSGGTYVNNQAVTASDGTFWVNAGGTSSTTPPPGTNATIWQPLDASKAAFWQWGKIVGIVDPTTFFGTYAAPSQSVIIVGPTQVSQWQLGLYSDTFGWPTCGCYHEGRLWLSGVIPNRIDGSVSNQIFAFTPTTADGTVVDSNAISATFNAKDANPIFWMLSNVQGIICGTQGGEWLVHATTQNLPLTPTNIQAHKATAIGCANIEPRETGNTIVFAQRYQRKLLEYFPDVFSGRLTAPNLSETAKHLTTAGLAEIVHVKELAPIVWARMSDGSLKGVTYKRENLMSSQGPNFSGWHRHTLGSGRVIESMCPGASSDGNLDSLVLSTNDPATNIRHVEVLTDMFDEGGTLTSAWFLDSAINSQSYRVNDVVSVTVNGLSYVEGKTVSAFIGGVDCGDYTVSNGSITVPFGDGIGSGTGNGLFTADYLLGLSAPQVLVGFTYTSRGQILRPAAPDQAGTRNGPAFGKLRRQEYVAAFVHQAAQGSVSFGTDFSGTMRPIQTTDAGGNLLSVLTAFTGIYRTTLDDDESFDGMICWQITRPYPCVITAISGFIQTQDV